MSRQSAPSSPTRRSSTSPSPTPPAKEATKPTSPTKQSNQAAGSSAAGSSEDHRSLIRASGAKSLVSSLMKSPAEAFILGETKFDLEGAQKFSVVMSKDGPKWSDYNKIFTCTITNPVRESKFAGLKTFISYTVTPSSTKVSVPRRFKHFEWLHDHLVRKFGLAIIIPPVPDKQLTGRYEEEFVEERRVQLECWLGRMALHPVMSKSEVLQHFVTAVDDVTAWKAGKRIAEKDDAVGGSFLNTIATPAQAMDPNAAEETLQQHCRFIKSMDDVCRHLITLGIEDMKKCMGTYRKEYEKLGHAFMSLSETFEMDKREAAASLTQAVRDTGLCYETIGELYNSQPKHDWVPFIAALNEYKLLLDSFPTILGYQKSAIEKNRLLQKLKNEGKVTADELKDAGIRTEKLSYAIQAEYNHFQYYRVPDFSTYMSNFLKQQVAFHKEIVKKLEATTAKYRSLVPK